MVHALPHAHYLPVNTGHKHQLLRAEDYSRLNLSTKKVSVFESETLNGETNIYYGRSLKYRKTSFTRDVPQ